ncbi:hypothetical protein HPP92_017820 [Vanilla planifolia]|uniref:Receptor-like serine/threonine-protein kinase n=1 Tax=Vanilla planifolia TaxID=51239 RepID=A0A835UMR6_VANPL|nr:hypothetical protein HPP92_017820 [Vanilla planifolia]
MGYPLLGFLLLLDLVAITTAAAANGQSSGNITLNSSLTAGAKLSYWLSPSGDFAFGFVPLPGDSSLFLLAIYYATIPNSSNIIWIPALNLTLSLDSSVVLTPDGQLSLRDPTGAEVWNPSVQNAAYAAMLDSGNFVIGSSNGSYLWESFSSPVDTILPTQSLLPNSKLISKLANDDFNEGRFEIIMQGDGSLYFYSISVPTGNLYSAYWSSTQNPSNSRLFFNSSGRIDLVTPTGEVISALTTAVTKSTADFYHRGTIDPDGVFRHYVHPKPSTEGAADQWTVMDFKPADICRTQMKGLGSGTCGFNSYCQYDSSGMVICQCPEGYSWVDPKRTYKGCKPVFAMPSCIDGVQSVGFRMVAVINLDFPLDDYEYFNPMNADECAQRCLEDCFCAASISDGTGNCWKKKFPMSDGVNDTSVQRTAFLKVGSNDALPSLSLGRNKSWTLSTSLGLGGSVLLNFTLVSAILLALHVRRRKSRQRIEDVNLGPSLRSFTFSELEVATKGFGEEVGKGACGTVYRGYLCSEQNGNLDVAVKKLRDFEPEMEKEFTNEVKIIGQTHHKNLVLLLGYCNQGVERLLVYEYMCNGTLASYLFGSVRPPWKQREEIVLGIAKGLCYLHEECSTQIIHCDIKPQNVLLDGNFTAKISDFGLSKLLLTDQTRTITGMRGTKGYVAPEWFKKLGITAKVDVYSFGVMLLEIVCCRRNVEKEMTAEKAVLCFWASDCHKAGRIDLLVEGDDEAMNDMGSVERFVIVALRCLQEDPSLRPSMGRVTQVLEETVAIPLLEIPSEALIL